MASIADVAAYILRHAGQMTTMKLQKLAYYSYGFHLAWEDRPLFSEHFEAWANGPVSPVLYRLHRGRFQLGPGAIDGDPEALDAGERESVNLVLGSFGELTAHQLSALTHQEPPWRLARDRAGVADLERSDEPLKDPEIYEYFSDVLAQAPQG